MGLKSPYLKKITMASEIGSANVCIPLEVEVTRTFWNADPVGLWVGFLIGAIVGALFAIPCGVALLRDIAKKMVSMQP